MHHLLPEGYVSADRRVDVGIDDPVHQVCEKETDGDRELVKRNESATDLGR